jgi:gliding motility-associated-like protein
MKMKKVILLFFVLIIGAFNSYATHNRAGEITYEHISGFTYRIIVTTYTKESSTSADRCELTVFFGDGDTATAFRINGPLGSPCSPGIGNGVSLGNDIKKNIYEVTHTYSGGGAYIVTMEDPNRNSGICNIPNSVEASFFLRTELIINPFLGSNNSPTLLNPPIDNACVGECFEHNPGAFDADGDSLAYSLVTCYANGSPIIGYTLPPTDKTLININPLKGDVSWCAPPIVCQYNIAILIKEYRRLPGSNVRYYIGSVLRDMQIDVKSCINNPPQIKHIDDTCVVAGTNLSFTVTATDNEFPDVSLAATGGPLEINPPATFFSTPSHSPVTGTFSWTPNCKQVQLLPYLVTFKATDGNSNPLTDFESVFIRVIAPAPTNVTATPTGASILLNWDAVLCKDTLGDNPFMGYQVYRKNSCDPWVHSACETGVPSYTGYTLLGTTNNITTTFKDNNSGQGLINGVDYSYIVVANYLDGSQSFSSTHVCAKLVRDVPIITNVSVISTGKKDSIWTHWVKPIANSDNLDTIAFPPPYEYRLMIAPGFSPAADKFSQVASYTYPSFWQLTDTGYVSVNLNTQDSAYTSRVDFYSNDTLVGSTNTASSVFLSSSPTDNLINLSWQENVPWSNYRYDVYRETFSGSGIFDFVDSTVTQTYADTGLVNGKTYCYKIVSIGQYSDTALPRPLFNSSQIRCDVPIDIIPPCQPKVTISKDCEIVKNTLTWTNPNTYCSDDGMKYFIYFGATSSSTLQLIDSVNDINTITYIHESSFEGVPSVAGCYAVTAIDSTGNESPIVTKKCVDNCPVYVLPNVFSPNGDGINDLFQPLMPYRFVKDVDMKIFNRWGTLMFETTDRDILWDGKNSSTKKMCPDGVYFYICTVNEIHVDGIEPHTLKGFIQLFDEKQNQNK